MEALAVVLGGRRSAAYRLAKRGQELLEEDAEAA
jgi:hypothetical protein